MQTPNGPHPQQAIVLMHISDGTHYVPEVEQLLTLKQLILLDHFRAHGKDALVKSLRTAHDLILYASEQEIDKEMKDTLFDLKLLSDWLEES